MCGIRTLMEAMRKCFLKILMQVQRIMNDGAWISLLHGMILIVNEILMLSI